MAEAEIRSYIKTLFPDAIIKTEFIIGKNGGYYRCALIDKTKNEFPIALEINCILDIFDVRSFIKDWCEKYLKNNGNYF